MKELEKQITNLCQDGNALNDDMGQEFLVISKSKYEEKVNKLKEVQRLWMFSQKELVDAKETNEFQLEKVKKFEATSKENESHSEKLQKTIKEYQASENRLITELDESQKRRNEAENKLNEKIAENKNKLEEKRIEIESLMKECKERIEKVINENNAKITELTTEIEKSNAELKEYSDKIVSVEKEKDKLLATIDRKDAEIQACNDLKEFLSETKKQIVDREADLEALQREYGELRETHEEFVENYQSQLEELREEVEIRDAENDMLKEKVDKLIGRLKRAENKPKWK